MSVVIDTNVLVVANGGHPPAANACVLACIEALEAARAGVVLVDDGGRILDEYARHASHAGQPGVGDRFFKWLWDHQAMAGSCSQVSITDDADRGFAEFPDDPALAAFDRDDRKFVAVALASGLRPPVLNASDSDWWEFDAVLKHHGVDVDYLCPELMPPCVPAKTVPGVVRGASRRGRRAGRARAA